MTLKPSTPIPPTNPTPSPPVQATFMSTEFQIPLSEANVKEFHGTSSSSVKTFALGVKISPIVSKPPPELPNATNDTNAEDQAEALKVVNVICSYMSDDCEDLQTTAGTCLLQVLLTYQERVKHSKSKNEPTQLSQVVQVPEKITIRIPFKKSHPTKPSPRVRPKPSPRPSPRGGPTRSRKMSPRSSPITPARSPMMSPMQTFQTPTRPALWRRRPSSTVSVSTKIINTDDESFALPTPTAFRAEAWQETSEITTPSFRICDPQLDTTPTEGSNPEAEDISDLSYYLAHHRMHHVMVEEEKNFLAVVRKRKRKVDDIAFGEVDWKAPSTPTEPLRPHVRYNYRQTVTWRTPKSLIKYLGHGEPRPAVSRQPHRKSVKDTSPAPLALYDAPIDTGNKGRRRTPSLKQRLRDEYVSIITQEQSVAVASTPPFNKGVKRKSPSPDAEDKVSKGRARSRSRRGPSPSTPQATAVSQLKLLKKLQYLQLRRQLAIIQRQISPPLSSAQTDIPGIGEVPSPPAFTLQSSSPVDK